MSKSLRRALLLSFALLKDPSGLRAAVRLPNLIGDHMVIQRNLPASIWGWADPGEQVTVSFQGQQKTATTRAAGQWRIFLDPMQAGGPFDLRIAGTNSLTIKDVMIGEVWIASGQSNMWWPVRLAANAQKEIAEANSPQVRMFTVKQTVSEKILDNVEGKWAPAMSDTVAEFSAAAYYFGRELHQHLKMPVGLISTAWGATPAEAWTSRSALEGDLSLQPILWNWKRTLLEYPYAMERYQKQLREWEEKSAEAKAQGKAEPRRPFPPLGSGRYQTFDSLPNAQFHWTPGGLFNSMIAPLTRFSIRGAIWYQGETSAEPYRAREYQRLFQTMISDWRRAWDQGPFPFLFAQLANFQGQAALGLTAQPNPSESAWAELREAQMMALALPNTGMAVTIDIGSANDIHPKNKQEVGRRFSLLARSVAFGEPVVASGPIYRGLTMEGNRIRIRFDHLGGGLVAKADPLKGFTIAGRDRKLAPADARIEGDSVVVSSSHVSRPVAVRYAWADNPEATLFNRNGLPASPFRTDEWSELDKPGVGEDPR